MQTKSKIRVIIDTNVWISFLIGKRLASLQKLLVDGQIKLILSAQLLEEIKIVTSRPKLAKYFKIEAVSELLNLLELIGEFYLVNTKVEICRDPKDNFLLELSLVSKSDFLVSSDTDLLILKKFKITKIISPKEFESLLLQQF